MSRTTRPSPGPALGSPRRILAGWLLGTVLLTGTLTGCAAAPELDPAAARELQAQVLSVTAAAAANDPAASLKHLDELAVKLDEAAARGEVSFKRHQSIRKSVDAVRVDLSAQQAEAARVAAEQEAAAQAAAAAAAQAKAAAAAAAAPPPAVAPAPPADSGKTKAKGKGNG
jgi:hypothetical protein